MTDGPAGRFQLDLREVRMRRAVIVDAVRTPFGKGREGGALSGVHPVDLLAHVIEALVGRTGVDPAGVDDVIAGCGIPVGEQGGNIARHAWLAAGFPESVPGVTIDRKCGSSQQAVHFAAQGVIAGAYDLVVAAGVEMMSVVPMKANRMGRDSIGPRLARRYPDGLVPQGISAELIAAKWDLDRGTLDEYALRSHQRAAAAEREGRLAGQIIPVDVPAADGGTVVVDHDEGIRPDTSLEKLSGLRPVFENEAYSRRFPDIRWVVTAGNSSPITDGASAALVMAEERAAALGLAPRAAVTGFALAADDPIFMLTGIIPATFKLLERAGLRGGDIDVFEVNEAFASVVLAWLRETGADVEKVNVNGGAIAFGHPVGASGCRLIAATLDALDERDGVLGMVVMCESGGMANATLLERIG
jgi:acetyl-CoA acyltransferase